MPSLFTKMKSSGNLSTIAAAKDTPAKKKDDAAIECTPLERLLQNAGPLAQDGRDRFLGFENFGNTCYCNSIVQALFHSDLFRQGLLNYPFPITPDASNGAPYKPAVTIRPPVAPATTTMPQKQQKMSSSQILRQRQTTNAGQPMTGQQPVRPEDKPDTPEYKKKKAMLKGPILELAQENPNAFGMLECTFTGLRDIFLAVSQSNSRTGVLSPQRFLEVFKRDNEMFQSSNHQDAHEFLRLVLNDVMASVDNHASRVQEQVKINGVTGGASQSLQTTALSVGLRDGSSYSLPSARWVHDVFEGIVTSETKCLTCETASQRDQTFLDLSIALDEHTSVTSCLRKFSAEEMLCERDKFQCDLCGGLQEAEKRIKVKKLPKVLTLHLNRFRYTEDYSRVQKLFHRVVYPYHLRMFHTADDAEDPDRLYELYAVVVHIGGNGYHGHYVSIVKTKERGWLLFDDEMVEPVDKHFVRNFFGDRPGMATAYLLFYQETTFDKVRAEQEAEGCEEVRLAEEAANVAHDGEMCETLLSRQKTQPVPASPGEDGMFSLAHARSAPDLASSSPGLDQASIPPVPALSVKAMRAQTKEERKRQKKELAAAEKAARQQEKEETRARDREMRELEKKRHEKALELIQARQARREEEEEEDEDEDEDEEDEDEDEMEKALEMSKKSGANKEEECRRKKEQGNGGSALRFMDRSKRSGRTGSLKGFGLFSKERNSDNGGPTRDVLVNGDVPEKRKMRGRLSMSSLGRKKSGNLLS